MYTDSHNHTIEFSADAQMTAPELLSAAAAKHLSSVVITEHLELDFPHPVSTPMIFDIDEFFREFCIWKNENNSGVTLLSGIELGYQKHLAARLDQIASNYPFDSIILSNHLFQGKDPYFYRGCYELPKEDLFSAYIDEMTGMVESCRDFDIVGHYDYIARYSENTDFKMRYADANKSFDRLFEAIIDKKKSLEINTRSVYKLRISGCTDALPDFSILEAYRKAGGTRITLGSDSHDNSTVGIYFGEILKLLKEAGFDYVTSYVSRKEKTDTIR